MPGPSPLHLAADAESVRTVACERLGATPVDEYTLTVAPPPDVQPALTLTISLDPLPGGGTGAVITAAGGIDIPFFAVVFTPLVWLARRRARAHAGAMLAAALAGEPLPPPPGPVFALPPVAFSHEQATLLATASAATAVVGFAAALFGQFADPISHTFGASDATIATALALTRVGVILALFVTALADRRGRRQSILVGVVGSAIVCAISAIAPNLVVFTGAQMLQRGLVITTATVAGIAVIEEAPEGARAYALSMLALAGGLGFSIAVVLLPLGDLGDNGWRIPFAIGAATILLVRPIAHRLAETTRYRAVAARTDVPRGRLREVLDRNYRRRFVLLAAVAFLTSIFSAPSSSLMNKYLSDVHGFSNTGIAWFRTVTTAIPGLVGLVLGGRLSEARGRRPVAAGALVVATVTQMIFFLGSGAIIWVMAGTSILAAGASGIAIGTLDAEMFPTEVRSTSNALLVVIGVLGSGTGLLVAGGLADALGGLGRSIALTGIAAVLATIFVLQLPESGMMALDDVSPTETGEYRLDP